MINQKGKTMKKNKYICITESLCHTAEIITTSQINYTSIKFLKILYKDGGRERAFKDGVLVQAETQRQGQKNPRNSRKYNLAGKDRFLAEIREGCG